MTIPLWVLLGFGGWTLLTLLLTVGWYRWSRIFTGRASITDFWAYSSRGADWYQRAQRAHANCIENLPVYTALVVAAVATGSEHAALDGLAITMLAARIAQTTTHVTCRPTLVSATVRFTFFFVQFACMVAMGCLIAAGVGAARA